LNRPARFILVSLKNEKKTPFRINWPFPLFILLMFSDMLVDLTDFAALFTRRENRFRAYGGTDKKISVRIINGWVKCIDGVLRESLSISETWEFLHIETQDVFIRIRVI